MSSAPPTATVPHAFLAKGDEPLRLALKFVRGAAEVRAEPRAQAGWSLDALRLRLGGVTFPVDLSQGAHGFRRHRSALGELRARVDAPALARAARSLDWAGVGLADVSVHHAGLDWTLMGSVPASARHAATPFSLRLGLVGAEAAAGAIDLIAYDVRTFGASGLSARTLAELVQRAMRGALGAVATAIDPFCTRLWLARAFCHHVLPAFGWRRARPHDVRLLELAADGDGIAVHFSAGTPSAAPSLCASPAAAQSQRARAELAPVLAAWRRADHPAAAAALQAGARETGPHARILASLWLASEASVEADGPYADAWKAQPRGGEADGPLPAEAEEHERLAWSLWQVAAIATWPAGALELPASLKGGTPAERAAAALTALTKRAQGPLWSRAPYDEVGLASWGAAALLANDDLRAARHLLAAARRRGLHVAGLYALLQAVCRAEGDAAATEGAFDAWLTCARGPAARAEVHVLRAEWALGREDVATAREALAAALAEVPEHAVANALAALVVAHSPQPVAQAQATEAVARLMALAERPGEARARAAWACQAARVEHALSGLAGRARQLVAFALSLCPAHVPSLKWAAALAEEAGEPEEASRWLERLVAEAARLPRGSTDLLQPAERLDVHLRLVEHAVARHGADELAGTEAGARAAHHLQCALALSPTRADLRQRLVSLLSALASWGPLAELHLRHAGLAAAEGELERARELERLAAALWAGPAAQAPRAVALLTAQLRERPADAEALHILLPLLASADDTPAALDVLSAAAAAEPEPLGRARWLCARARRLAASEAPLADKVAAIGQALALTPQHLEMATLWVELVDAHGRPGARAFDESLAAACQALAFATPAAPARGRVRLRAARALSWVERPEAARKLLAQALLEAPAEVDGWLFALALAEDAGATPTERGQLLERALAACADAPHAHRLWIRRADAAEAAGAVRDARAALERAIASGGATEANCERLLALLEAEGLRAEQAAALWRFAEAGWPLPVAKSYLRAARLWLPNDVPSARRALSAAVQAGGDVLWPASSLWLELAEQHDWPEDVALALEGMLRAVDEGLVAHADVPALEHRLMWAHERRGAVVEAESVCGAILQADANDAEGHAFLANRLLARDAWNEALDHLAAALLGPGRAQQSEAARARSIEAALPLAASLRPDLLSAFIERGDLPADAVARARALQAQGAPLAFADVLRARGQPALERRFLQHALGEAPAGPGRAQLRLRLAGCPTDSREQVLEAEGWLRQNLLENPRDRASREALVPILRALGSERELAELHFALSQLVDGPEQALEHVLSSAHYFLGRKEGRAMAGDILLSFARRQDVPRTFAPLWRGMRAAGFAKELCQLLEQSLEADPRADDGRLAELLDVLAHELGNETRAHQWCQRFEAYAPEADGPWALHAALALGRARPAPAARQQAATEVYRAWAAAREGEARARVLERLAEHLRQSGQADDALQALTAALAVPAADEGRTRARLDDAIEQHLAREDYAGAVPLLARRADQAPTAQEADASRRVAARVLVDGVGDAAAALEMALSVAAPDAGDAAFRLEVALRARLPARLLEAKGQWADWSGLDAARWLAALFADASWSAPLAALGQWAASIDGAEALWALWQALPCPVDAACDAAWRVLAADVLDDRLPARADELRLDGLARLAAADASLLPEALRPAVAQLGDRVKTGRALAAVAWADARAARQAFRLSRATGWPEVARRAASRLLAEGEGDDAADVLVTAIEADLADGELARAKERLGVLGRRQDARHERLLEQLLRAEGRWSELLEGDRRRVERAKDDEVPAARVAWAKDLLLCDQPDEAREVLEAVAAEARTAAWAEARFQVAHEERDGRAQAAAAALAASRAANGAARARWLRREAEIRWWQEGDAAEARRLLVEAERLAPRSVADIARALAEVEGERARRRALEALVVVPEGRAAPLYTRLSQVEAEPAAARAALQRALGCLSLDDGAGEQDDALVSQVFEAARRLGEPSTTAAAAAAVGRGHLAHGRFASAAEMFLEAARVAPAHEGAAPLAQSAEAWERAGKPEALRPLLERLVSCAAPPPATWPLVWRHWPEQRAAAAWHLLGVAERPQEIAEAERAEAWLLAAEHALAGVGDAARAGQLLQLAQEAMRADLAHAPADGPRRAFAVAERVAEQKNDLRSLVSLWQRAPRVAGLPADVSLARVRRAAHLAGSLAHNERTTELWRQLLDLAPDDEEAQWQMWLAHARTAAARAMTDARSVADVCNELSADMEAQCATLALGPARARRTWLAARVWQRVQPLPDLDIDLLGRAWQAAVAEGEAAEGARADAIWAFVREIGSRLAEALGQRGRAADALAVTGRMALLAPHEERLDWLRLAGEQAIEADEWRQAFQLLWPVAEAEPDGPAFSYCLEVCEANGWTQEAVALWTAKAARAEGAEAAAALAQAAAHAEQAPAGAAEALRLWRASYAIDANGRTQAALLQAYLAAGDAASLAAAAAAFDAAALVGVVEDDGQSLCVQLAEQLAAAVPVPSAAAAVLSALESRFGPAANVCRARLALARAIGSRPQLAAALMALADAAAGAHAAEAWPLYAEAASLQADAADAGLVRRAALSALADPAAPPSWGWQAWQLRGDADADNDDADTYDEALADALAPHLSQWQRFAAGPPRLGERLPEGWAEQQVAIWQLLAARAEARGDAAAQAGALETLVAWLALAGGAPHRAACWQLAELLSAQGATTEAREILSRVASGPQVPPDERMRAHLTLSGWSAASDPAQAAVHVEAARQWSGQAPAERPALALALLALGRLEEARAQASLDDDVPLSARPPAALAAALACQAWPALAAEQGPERWRPSAEAVAWARALVAQPMPPALAHFTLAAAAEADGQPQAALVAYERAASALEAKVAPTGAADACLWQRWAALQEVQGQPLGALDILSRGLSAHAEPAARRQLLEQACDLAERSQRWERAAALAHERIGLAGDAAQALRAALRASAIERVHLGDWQAAASTLWTALERHVTPPVDAGAALTAAAAEAWPALWELLDASEPYLAPDGPWPARRAQAAASVVAWARPTSLAPERALRLAEALATSDPAAALGLFEAAAAAGRVAPHLRGLWQRVAWQAEAWDKFIDLAEGEEAERSREAGAHSHRFSRRVALAEAHARQAQKLEAARPWLERALAQWAAADAPRTEDVADALRRLADLTAGLADLRPDSLRLYDDVLAHAPCDTEALRMAARVAGQQGDTERAWALYACLLWLLPTDAEAGRFVVACRAHAEDDAGERARPLVKHVQQALDVLVADGRLRPAARPSRAYDVSQLLRSDIEAVLSEMVSAPFGEPREHALKKVPEAYRLFCFSASGAVTHVREQLSSGRADVSAAPRTARAAGAD